MTLLDGTGLTRTYRLGSTRVPALRGVDIEIRRGDFVVLQGPSGSGKTTLINLLGLLDRPDSGRLLLDDRPVSALDEDTLSDTRRDRFGFVFQSFSLIPVLSALENVEYPLALRGTPRRERQARARSVLARVGLEGKEDVRPDLLSGGERQRVAIGRAIVNGPELVLADEPTANLDSETAASVLDLMRELNRERNVAFVVATHDPRVVERAGRILVLRDGRMASAS